MIISVEAGTVCYEIVTVYILSVDLRLIRLGGGDDPEFTASLDGDAGTQTVVVDMNPRRGMHAGHRSPGCGTREVLFDDPRITSRHLIGLTVGGEMSLAR